jgi:hypothetical protein
MIGLEENDVGSTCDDSDTRVFISSAQLQKLLINSESFLCIAWARECNLGMASPRLILEASSPRRLTISIVVRAARSLMLTVC